MQPYERHLERDFQKAQHQNPSWPIVISEGDSWFSYADVIGRLDDPGDKGPQNQRPWSLLRVEKAGDEVLTILSGAQRSNLRRIFRGCKVDALLFSGGGNDIIGPDLLPLLRPYKSGMGAADLVAKARYERRLRQIQDCYRELLDLLLDAEQKTKVFVHSYDYVVPSDRPVKFLGFLKLSGPWMFPYFKERNIPAQLHADVVKLLIDGFIATVDAVAAEPRSGVRLIRIETRGMINGEWKDEIHPNRKGAKKVAAAFESALRSEGVLK